MHSGETSYGPVRDQGRVLLITRALAVALLADVIFIYFLVQLKLQLFVYDISYVMRLHSFSKKYS